jgi:Icc protein
MRLLQLSDPHLLADPAGLCRGRYPLRQLRLGLQEALRQIGGADSVDLLLLSGDLCHDESWTGYAQLRDLLREMGLKTALLPGNHDQPQLLRAALGRHWPVAPALVCLGSVDLLLLDSHRPGTDVGWLGPLQLAWLQRQLKDRQPGRPLLVALHHPPLAIGDPRFDPIALADAPQLLALLRPVADLRAVLFGHIHRPFQGWLPALPGVPLLGCPSSLVSFGDSPELGARLLDLGGPGRLLERLLRWPDPGAPSLQVDSIHPGAWPCSS